MTKFPDDDRKLVEFLRQYQPTAPTANGETQLMNLIAKQPQHLGKKSRRSLWIASPILAIVGFLFWGGNPWLTPKVNIASDSNELEAFMVDSWQDSLDNTPNQMIESTSYEYSAFNPMIIPPEVEQSASQP